MSQQTLSEDRDISVDATLFEYDKIMPIPDIENEPHLLISKVRKHYMEYIIKLLSVNYENNQRLLNKNIRLPSAIWRCAKNIEMTAAQTCMVVQLYRKNIVTVIKELKHNTKEGKLYTPLYEFVNKPPENEKKVQTSLSKSSDCTCQCVCNQRKKRCKDSVSSKECRTDYVTSTTSNINTESCIKGKNSTNHLLHSVVEGKDIINKIHSDLPPIMSVESQESDLLMQQLEMLFQGDCNDDDIFEHSICDIPNSSIHEMSTNNVQKEHIEKTMNIGNQNLTIENSEQQSFDERLASLAGQLVNPNDNNLKKPITSQNKRRSDYSKWLCEEYFLKLKLFDILDQLRDGNRAKLSRIKVMLIDLFGEDSDDEGVMSPLDETPNFIRSCKERIAPWVVRMLTPFYIKGRIKGKALFKSVAKHLIRLIYQCSKYPSEYEVKSFVSDFLESHKIIRCEADFKQFRIDNI